ncbi:MAG: PfkB family carbohydrate kinase [Saprospiraceae bacterium]|nr:PfkB family carbohydrate kinase [Saprospiraceae bacterium]|tara:strand:- start:609 stop:1523 length:915 start_codon:yes stop_codon:yes gene_type:complete
MSLLVVGTVAYDTIETPFGKEEMVIGGSGQYIGYAASYFVNDIKIVSIIGDDYQDKELSDMKNRGMDLDGVEVVKDGKSFFWAGKYHDDMNGRDTLVTDLNVLADFDPKIPNGYKDSEYIMLGNLTPDIQISVLDQLSVKPKLVMLDTMNFWMDVALDRLKEVLKRVDVLTINDEEARQLSGEYALIKAAEVIQKMGPKYLIIKKGEHGALLFHGDDVFFAPALPLHQVKDPTGAGDCFAGGFIGYMASTGDSSFENMKRGIVHGSAMASFCVEDFSNWNIKKLDQKNIDDRLRRFYNLTRFEL